MKRGTGGRMEGGVGEKKIEELKEISCPVWKLLQRIL
jgi:hypothetical protein